MIFQVNMTTPLKCNTRFCAKRKPKMKYMLYIKSLHIQCTKPTTVSNLYGFEELDIYISFFCMWVRVCVFCIYF